MQIEQFEFFQALINLPFVEEVLLYGSRARGDFNERADIDLAILCPEASKHDWMGVMEIIEGADTLLKIDCVRLDELSPHNPLRHSINNEGIVLFHRKKNESKN